MYDANIVVKITENVKPNDRKPKYEGLFSMSYYILFQRQWSSLGENSNWFPWRCTKHNKQIGSQHENGTTPASIIMNQQIRRSSLPIENEESHRTGPQLLPFRRHDLTARVESESWTNLYLPSGKVILFVILLLLIRIKPGKVRNLVEAGGLKIEFNRRL